MHKNPKDGAREATPDVGGWRSKMGDCSASLNVSGRDRESRGGAGLERDRARKNRESRAGTEETRWRLQPTGEKGAGSRERPRKMFLIIWILNNNFSNE